MREHRKDKGASRSFPVGVLVDSFRLPPREAVRKARQVGADGFQIYVVSGEMSPDAMNAAARKEFRTFVAGEGLEISALCGDLGGHGFQRADENAVKIPRSKAIIDLAIDLGTRVVTTHIGVVPKHRTAESWAIMRDACRELGEYAEARGATFAVETGPETAEELKGFLEEVGSKGIGVNLDPANLVMVTGDDPVAAVHILKPFIVHTHAKDGVQLRPCNAEKLYGGWADGTTEATEEGIPFKEVPLGQGSVPWDAYLAALASIGFHGYLTIEREVGEDPAADISLAVRFLDERMARMKR